MGDRGEVRLGDVLLYIWRLSRPEAWTVTFLPLLVGNLLATRELLPGWGRWTEFWFRAQGQGASASDFGATLLDWALAEWRILVAVVVFGPLLWAATLLINDVHDLEGDRKNPRKARSPLVQGLLSRGLAHGAAYACALFALAAASMIGYTFLGLTFACLLLAWAYSVPPLRLKTRPGADVAVNSIGIGVLAFLAGWVLERPLQDAPLAFLPQGILVAIAVYVPTTMVDWEADRTSGYRTLATHLGPKRAYFIGWTAWVLANAGALALAWNDSILPRRFFPILLVFVPLLLYEYHAFIGRAKDGAARIQGIILTSLTFLCVNVVFALMYTGVWV